MALAAGPLDGARERAGEIPTYVWAIGLVALLLVVATIVVVALVRQRKKAAAAKAAAAAAAGKPDPSAAIRAAFEAIEARLAEKVASKAARDAIPRLLVLGEPGSGKTTLLAATLLNTPLDKSDDPRPGDGAPVNLWSFDKALVVDPAGELSLTEKGEAPDPPLGLDALVGALKRGRPARPLDAIVVAIPCTDLVPTTAVTDEDRKRKATTLKTELGDIQRKLGMRVPVYVLVTKCDALPSFRAFGRETADASRQGVLGWSRPDDVDAIAKARAKDGMTEDFVGDAMDSVGDRLLGRQVARFLKKPAPVVSQWRLGAADGLYLFPAELVSIADPMRVYLDEIFQPSVYDEPFMLRGIYFCGDGGGTLIAAPIAAATQMSGVRGVLFVRDLFDTKIIPEANLARPSRAAERRRGRAILALQIAAALIALGAGVGLMIEGQRLRAEVAVLEPCLQHIQRDLGLAARGNGPSPPPATAGELRDQALDLLADFSAIRTNRLASALIPLSSLSVSRGLDGRLLDAITVGYKQVVFAAFGPWIERKGRELVVEEAPLLHGAEPALNVETTPEFVHVDRWLEQVTVYDRAVQQYRRLGSRALKNGRELTPAEEQIESEARLQAVADLTDYLFAHRVEPGFFAESRYYRVALARGIGEGEFQVDAGPTLEARNKEHVLFGRLFDVLELHKDREVRDGLRGIEAGFEYLESNTSAYDKTFTLHDLRDLYEAIQRTDRLLRAPLLSWVPSGMPPESQGLSRLLSKVEASPLLGESEASTLHGEAEERLRFFQLTVKSASAPIAGYLLKRRKDGELDMVLSDELTAFKTALDDLLAERFMAAGVADRLPPYRERFTWDVELVKEAAGLVKDYDAFEQSAQFKRFRGATPEETQTLQRTMVSLAQKQLRVCIVNRVARSIVREPTLRGAPLADQTRADVENLRLATPPLRQILGAFIRFHLDEDRDDLREIVRPQGSRLLIDAYGVLSGKRLYEVKGGNFSWWRTNPTPVFDAFGVTDLAGLTEFVNGERTQASDTAKELAEPVLGLLESGEVGALLNPVEGMAPWRGVIHPLQDYEVKKPGNGVSALEHFILVDLPKLTLDSCLSFYPALGRSNDFFTAKARSIHRRLQERCAELSGETIQARYFDLWRIFNSQLSGRFPFAKLDPSIQVEDAAPEAVRDFLDKDSIEDKFYKTYHAEIARLAATGDEDWRQVQRFFNQLETVKAFLLPMWVQAESARDGAYDVDVEFRANTGHEVRGNQIAEWILEVPEKRLAYGEEKERLRMHWRMDDSVRFTLRWAKNGPDFPTSRQEDGKTSRGSVQDLRVSFETHDFWALLRFIAMYQSEIRDAGVAYDPTSNYLLFKVQTRPDANGGFVDRVGIDSGVAQVFIRLVLHGGDKKRLQKYPEFPVIAPPPPATGDRALSFEPVRAVRERLPPQPRPPRRRAPPRAR
jgi:type VI secretion system protein ImpL